MVAGHISDKSLATTLKTLFMQLILAPTLAKWKDCPVGTVAP
jgi:hypothetical protein